MKRAHKIKLNPTSEQIQFFTASCDATRFAFNWGLGQWNEQYAAYRQGERDKPPNSLELKKQFNAIKYEAFPWINKVAYRSVEWGFECLGVAWRNYFQSKGGKRKGQPMARPQFKSRFDDKQSFRAGVGKEIKVDGHELRIPRLDTPLNMTERLRYNQAKINSVIISHYAGQWWAAFFVDVPEVLTAVASGVIGVDLGIKTLAVLSDGTEYANPKRYAALERKLARLQRSLSRKQKGSKKREKAKAQVAKLHYQIACQRADAIHKMTRDIAGKAGTVGLEDLNVKGMTRNRRLAKSVSDASFGEIRRQLEYKVKRVVIVGRFFASSQTCSECGRVNPAVKDLAVRLWLCPGCGAQHDRDVNAARNIRDEAIRLTNKEFDHGFLELARDKG